MPRAPVAKGSKIPLGEIKVGSKLGEGGFGVVHEATIAGIDFPFAVKFLDPSHFNADLGSARERFFREAELLFKLRHPNIIAIYGVGEYEGKPYILMERFNGFDLVRAREMSLPEPIKVLPFIECIAEALAFAHAQNVIHRDIKPKNLMATRGSGRVLDFGIAGILDPEGTRLTRTGGTPVGDSFSAPELAEDPRLLDPRCDVYSLGACWFWLLTGRTPKGLNWEAALRSSVAITPQYERVLLRCLAQAEARYATMGELVAEVQALRSGGMPRAGLDGLTEPDKRVLGTIAAWCCAPDDSVALYEVEQNMRGAVSRFALSVAGRKLARLGLVNQVTDTDWNGNEYAAFRLTGQGALWVEAHQAELESLLERPQENQAEASADDIPF